MGAQGPGLHVLLFALTLGAGGVHGEVVQPASS